jgi:hypothetical protein
MNDERRPEYSRGLRLSAPPAALSFSLSLSSLREGRRDKEWTIGNNRTAQVGLEWH